MRKTSLREEALKEASEHPALVEQYGFGIAMQIARDHRRKPKTTTKEGKNSYMKDLMRRRRFIGKQKKNLSTADFDTLWRSFFENPKNKAPEVNYKKWR